MNVKSFMAFKEARTTLDRLLSEFRTGKLVGGQLKKDLEHLREQISILENQEDNI